MDIGQTLSLPQFRARRQPRRTGFARRNANRSIEAGAGGQSPRVG